MKKIYVFLLGVLFAFVSNAQIYTFDFDNLVLPDTGFWNGSDTSVYNHYFGDSIISFPNNYNETYGSWDGFAFSSWTDTTTEGYTNQWSVYAGQAHSDSIFGLAYVPVDWSDPNYPTIPININFDVPVRIDSMFITNSTYTALAIKNGTSYSEPFSTDSSDYLKLIIYFINNNDTIANKEFYLADYTNSTPVVVKDWQKLDFTSKENLVVTKLAFDMVTTDVGDYGPNTPLYFCIDDISFSIDDLKVTITRLPVKLYPNPSADYIKLGGNYANVKILSIDGKAVLNVNNYHKNQALDINFLNPGTYIIQTRNNNEIKISKFVKL